MCLGQHIFNFEIWNVMHVNSMCSLDIFLSCVKSLPVFQTSEGWIRPFRSILDKIVVLRNWIMWKNWAKIELIKKSQN